MLRAIAHDVRSLHPGQQQRWRVFARAHAAVAWRARCQARWRRGAGEWRALATAQMGAAGRRSRRAARLAAVAPAVRWWISSPEDTALTKLA